MRKTEFAPSQEGMLLKRRGMLFMVQGGEATPVAIEGGAFGTLSSLDSLQAIRQSVADYGEDRAWDSISIAMDAWNRQAEDMSGELWERGTEQQRAYGTLDTKQMQEMDQWGTPEVQKVTAGVTVGFPLRRYGDAIGWTYDFMLQNTVAQLAAEVDAIAGADFRNMMRAAKQALYVSTNYSFVDKLGGGGGTPNVTLAVKALVNNDGLALPVGPNGETYATSHNHYLANATLTAGVLTNLIVTVQEHFNEGTPIVVISQTDEATVRALTGFIADVDARIVQPQTATYTTSGVDVRNLYDRRIGLFGAAEVWIKPWAIPNYALCYIRGNMPRPLLMRVPERTELANLRLVVDDERHPLYARAYERRFGMGAWNRVAAGVLYFAGGAYVNPTIV